jgi:hypothetical protein
MPLMETIHQEVTVRFRYPVQFTRDLFSPNNPLLALGHSRPLTPS